MPPITRSELTSTEIKDAIFEMNAGSESSDSHGHQHVMVISANRLEDLEESVSSETIWYARRRGSPVWTVNRVRSSLLPAIILDLEIDISDGELSGQSIVALQGICSGLDGLCESYQNCPTIHRVLLDMAMVIKPVVSGFADGGLDRNSPAYLDGIVPSCRLARDTFAEVVRGNQGPIALELDSNAALDLVGVFDSFAMAFPHAKQKIDRLKKAVTMTSAKRETMGTGSWWSRLDMRENVNAQ